MRSLLAELKRRNVDKVAVVGPWRLWTLIPIATKVPLLIKIWTGANGIILIVIDFPTLKI